MEWEQNDDDDNRIITNVYNRKRIGFVVVSFITILLLLVVVPSLICYSIMLLGDVKLVSSFITVQEYNNNNNSQEILQQQRQSSSLSSLLLSFMMKSKIDDASMNVYNDADTYNITAVTSSYRSRHSHHHHHSRVLESSSFVTGGRYTTIRHADAPDAEHAQFFQYQPDTYDFIIRYTFNNNSMEALVKKNRTDPTIYIVPCPEYNLTRLYCYDEYGQYNFTLDIYEKIVNEDVTESTSPTFYYTRVDGATHIVNDPTDTFFDDNDNNLATDTILNITQQQQQQQQQTIDSHNNSGNSSDNNATTELDTIRSWYQSSKNWIIMFTLVTIVHILIVLVVVRMCRRRERYHRQQVLQNEDV